MRLISAQVTIKNDGTDTVTVDSLVVELFRAQNLAPHRITALAERWNNAPVPNDQQVPAVPKSLLQESPRFWYADPFYDQCCDDQCMNQIESMSSRLTCSQATTRSSTSLTRRTPSSWRVTWATCGTEGPRVPDGPWRQEQRGLRGRFGLFCMIRTRVNARA